ncbi:hypothetical protein B0A49_02402 [Cryomyces minteri]|uniref:Uncharacterized protein n=1 Tax=Cryomyces minteri TaxID=331657 RepID=A0A4U0XE85_9PEZI|nr:hypothetical protein B0A49_02402 [Cryomyces minteri]
MRTSILLLLFSILYTFALAKSNSAFAPFFAPFFDSDTPAVIQSNETIAHELLKRQTPSNACPSTYKSCSGLGAPGLCCPGNTNCSPDMAGHVACCPSGAACTGTIGAVNTGGTTPTSSGLAGVVTSTTTTSAGNGLVLATIAEGHGDTVVLLLKAGAETDKRDSDGKLAIDLAPDPKIRSFIIQSAEREGIELS